MSKMEPHWKDHNKSDMNWLLTLAAMVRACESGKVKNRSRESN